MTRFRRHASAGTITPRRGIVRRPRPRPSTFARLVGAVGMVTLTVVLYWLLTDDGFRVSQASVSFEGLRHADEAAVREQLAVIDRRPNIFRVRAEDIVRTVGDLPDVDAAAATVTLPAGVSVRLQEREPLFVWSDGKVAWLVDEEGMLFGPTGGGFDEGEPDPSEGRSGRPAAGDGEGGDDPAADGVDLEAAVAELGLPVVRDDRLPAEPISIGSHLPGDELAIMRQLLTLTPELLGSRAGTLDLRVDQNIGYILVSDRGWQAYFGHYSPRIQPAAHIPRQVQCLQAAIAAHERRLEVVRLALSETGCGTFTRRD